MKISTSKELFEQAKEYIPGGVNSPVRAFKAVGGDPIFFANAEGAYLYDEDGNNYIDLINSWGPMILGHAKLSTTEVYTHLSTKHLAKVHDRTHPSNEVEEEHGEKVLKELN